MLWLDLFLPVRFLKQLSVLIAEQILDFCRKSLIARAQDIYPTVADVS